MISLCYNLQGTYLLSYVPIVTFKVLFYQYTDYILKDNLYINIY